jgi:hypothetical protein
MTKGRITLPHRFTGGGYQVTVNADRSINVRQGDWLSKYSMAIYGDFDHVDKFWRKNGALWEEIKNKNLIKTGEILYHRDLLPGEVGVPAPAPQPAPKQEIPASVIEEFLRWLVQAYQRTEWWVETSGGSDFGLFFGSIQKLTLGIRNRTPRLGPQDEIIWFHAGAAGLSIGWPDITVSGSYSDVDFWSRPWPILKAPWYTRLTRDDFRGGMMLVDFGMGLGVGKSVVFLFFGIGFPPSRILHELQRFFHGDFSALRSLLLRGSCSGVAILEGNNSSLPGAGIAGRAGVMYDRAYWGF